MNTTAIFLLFVATFFGARSGLAQKREKSVPPALEPRVKQFFMDKEAQAHALASEENKEQVPEIWEFFDAGQNGDWKTVADIYRSLARRAYQYEGTQKDSRLETMVWQPVNEAFGAYDQCANMEEKYVTTFGRGIIDSMPRGSIYFGGTDPGRWIVTAFCKSHPNGDPIFVLTQNALADGLYLKYLRFMYGNAIAMPSDDDSKKAFEDYKADARQRLKNGDLKPGENVKDVGGNIQVSGQVAVMAVNARIARTIFDANPEQEFYLEESFPLDWMYPHLAPHGLILKLNRKPPTELSAEVVAKDREYWTRFSDRALGKWLTPETTLEKVCEFATTVFENQQMEDFKGDVKFVQNRFAYKTYSKLRSSIGGVYAWRAKNSASAKERQRMVNEADFAFRQAFALWPSSPEAVVRYANLLKEQKRTKEALLVAETAERIDPGNRSISNLARELDRKQ